MFPNQEQSIPWGVQASDYYGNYASGSTWYNWAQTGRIHQDTGARGYQVGSSYLMSNQEKSIKEESSDAVLRNNKNNNTSQPKLGINSNVYKMCSSIYQNSQTKQISPQNTNNRFNMRPDVTISPISGNTGVTSLTRYSTESFPSSCLQNDKSSGMVSQINDKQDLPTSSLSLQKSQDMQQKLQAEATSTGSEPTLFVEPDSSTDLSAEDSKKRDYTNKKENEQTSSQDTNKSINIISPFEDTIETEDFFGNNDSDEEDDDDDDDEDEDDLLESSDEGESAENFVKVKMERESIDGKFNPKSNMSESGATLPLHVELQEYDSNPQPPHSFSKQMSMAFFNSSMMNGSMMNHSSKPNKRGRRPKHYSDILFELGQRGISITRASPLENQPAMGKRALSSGSTKVGTGQQLKCPHCNKILTTSVGLMYHIRLHTGEKPYSCDLCGKQFATSSHYHYHIRTHSGEKPYRCDFCGKMYTASGSLRLHLKSHLSRLAADARQGLHPSLMMLPQDPLMVGEHDFPKIKQEMFDPEQFQVRQ